jgi:hypothetical protein
MGLIPSRIQFWISSFVYRLARFCFYFDWQGFVAKIFSSKMADKKA